MKREINYTAAELKQALSIISDYLQTALLQNPPSTKVKLGSVGYLIKKPRTVQANLVVDRDNQTCVYFHVQFHKSRSLKSALDQQISLNA